MACAKCGASVGHRLTAILDYARGIFAQPAYQRCPEGDAPTRADYDALLKRATELNARVLLLQDACKMETLTKAARLNEASGAWKRSQAVCRWLHARAAETDDEFLAVSLREFADEIGRGGELS